MSFLMFPRQLWPKTVERERCLKIVENWLNPVRKSSSILMSFLEGFSEKACWKCGSEPPLQQECVLSGFGWRRHRKSDTRNPEKQQNHGKVVRNHNSAETEKNLKIDDPSVGKITFWSNFWGPGDIQITKKTMLWKVCFLSGVLVSKRRGWGSHAVSSSNCRVVP